MKSGYKQTEVGVIPEDWEVASLGKTATFRTGPFGSALHQSDYINGGIPIINPMHINDGNITPSETMTVSVQTANVLSDFKLKAGDIVIGRRGDMGRCAVVHAQQAGWLCGTGSMIVRPVDTDADYLQCVLSSREVITAIENASVGTTMVSLNQGTLSSLKIQLPPLPEQRAIATALSDMDALLDGLERLIAKKRDIKQATMQQLLTGKTRLPGFSGAWEVKAMFDSVDCLDNLRVPLNEVQRATMQGDYPYCGANGVLDYINNFLIDDDIILMAEDGGYFDEHETRPIAYRMIGKCWVNNHAHILKAKKGFEQGFIFYSLVHKDILPFLASGTRAKLNKSELFKIEVLYPPSLEEQTAIANILSDMDAELAALEARRDKTRQIKQAMMQELLTGKTRLV